MVTHGPLIINNPKCLVNHVLLVKLLVNQVDNPLLLVDHVTISNQAPPSAFPAVLGPKL